MNSIKEWFAAHVVSNWRDAWKWLSMHFALALLVWESLSQATQAEVVAGIAGVLGINVSVTAVLTVGIIVGRIIAQRKLQEKTP